MENSTMEEEKGSVIGENRSIIRPPDAKLHALNIRKIQAVINQKEVEFKMLQNKITTSSSNARTPGKFYFSHDKETLTRELKTLREEREKDCQLRKHLDQELKTLNSQILYKNDSCSRLNAALRYKSEERIDDAIRRLEHQINVQQLTIREEKRMVTEIDSLRRSKKTLKEFLESRKLLDGLRTRQKSLRASRDACSRKINGCKSKEEAIKTALDQLEAQADQSVSQDGKQHSVSQKEALKKEIDELYKSKRELIAKFNTEKSEYQATMKDIRAEIVQQRKVESLKKAEERNAERQLQLKEIKQKQRSFQSYVEDQLTLCRNLSGYLEKLQNSLSVVPHTPNAALEENCTSVVVKNDETAGMFLRQKSAPDAEMVGLYAGLGRKGSKKLRKSRRTATGQSSRKLVLHPDVIKQLLTLNLNVPGTAAELPQLLEELKEKQVSLENPVSEDAAVGIGQANKPTDHVDENINTSSTDVDKVTSDVAIGSSSCRVSKMNTRPLIPISDGNAPDFKVEFSNEMTDELKTLPKSKLVTELNDGKTTGDTDDYSDDNSNVGDHDDAHMSLLKVSHNDSLGSTDSQNSTKKEKIKSKVSNEDCKLSQPGAVERDVTDSTIMECAAVYSEEIERAAMERNSMERETVERETVEREALERAAIEREAVEREAVEREALELPVVRPETEQPAVKKSDAVEGKPVENGAVECAAAEHETVRRGAVSGHLPCICKQDEDIPALFNDASLSEREQRTLNEEVSINLKTDDKYLKQNLSASYSCCGSCVSERINDIKREPEEQSSAPNVLVSAGKDVHSDGRSCKVLLKENSLSFDDNVTPQRGGTELHRIACEKCPA